MAKILFWIILLGAVAALITGVKNPDNTAALYTATVGTQIDLLLGYVVFKC